MADNSTSRKRLPTLDDVAALAGVGRGTVSRAINGAPNVSERSQAAVMDAVKALGYVPNKAARSLVTRRNDSVTLVISESEERFFSDPFFSAAVRGITGALAGVVADAPADHGADRGAAPCPGGLPGQCPRRRGDDAVPARPGPVARATGAARSAARARRSPARGGGRDLRRRRQRCRGARRRAPPPPDRSPSRRGHRGTRGHGRERGPDVRLRARPRGVRRGAGPRAGGAGGLHRGWRPDGDEGASRPRPRHRRGVRCLRPDGGRSPA